MRLVFGFVSIVISSVLLYACSKGVGSYDPSAPRKIEILFLGHNSEHHNSAKYMPMLAAVLAKEGINFTYNDDPAVLNKEALAKYDGLMIYANHEQIKPEQEAALLDFVASGKGFLPIHCASFCFQNSPEYIKLVGGQFLKHDTAIFTASIINKEHPVTKSLSEFSTWDETYVHDKLTDDRTVLMERVEGDHHEPWTWVKEHGKGRVFYTAYGHDERTWGNPGFHELMKQGILWAVGDQMKTQWEAFRKSMPVLVYKSDPNIPNYEQRVPLPKYQDPLSPEESKKYIQIPVGFDLELFASEPDIINPIAMDWDEKGRLWVIETVDYPNNVLDDRSAGDDRIKICEDTNGDGKADKFTIFADKLNIPTSLVFSNGGIIVSQAPNFLFLKDTNGDDKADVKKIISEGWGTFDTHAGPSSLKYGFDNQIWGVVGYSGFTGTMAGQNMKFDQCVYHFKPDLSSFELVARTTNNTWGLGFTENNDVFASTANNTHSVFVGIPSKGIQGIEGVPIGGSSKIDGHYAMHPITEQVRQVDVFGGFTAAAGHNFYTARAFPNEYLNMAFVSEPTGHLVHVARIEKKGAGFIEKDGWNLFAGADEWVAPVDAKVGPDGAVWVLDWYNFIIQHNPTPTAERGGYKAVTGKGNAYENPLRDKSHGRIWRVVSRDAKSYDPMTLDKKNEGKLIDAFSNDNLFWRLTAQRLLVERGNIDVLPTLYDIVKGDNDHAAIHALWTIDGLSALMKDDKAEDVVKGALKHKSPAVRKAAIQILSKGHLSEQLVRESNILNDSDAGVRLAAINALIEISPSDAMGSVLYKLSTDDSVKNDTWLSQAVYVSANHHKEGFIKAFKTANADYKGKSEIHREAPVTSDASWKTMELPSSFEKAGLKIDGLVWFRRSITIPLKPGVENVLLSLGPINDKGEIWLNGNFVGVSDLSQGARTFKIPVSSIKNGANVIAVRVEDRGGWGGIYGDPEELFIQVGTSKVSLAGTWKYEIEKEYNVGGDNLFEGSSIGEVFVETYSGDGKKLESIASDENATIIKISVVKNAMKFDKKMFEVEAGTSIQVVFENPDFMQHNLVIAIPGSLQVVGKAADKLAADPKGADQGYLPKIPEVLFATKLVNPQQTVKLNFMAPDKPGDYPFVCTFPGHWSAMNGVMKVVKRKPA
ncbi:MAG: PVC-type heme-binding CxxCH protein [Chryseolinea sp.]